MDNCFSMSSCKIIERGPRFPQNLQIRNDCWCPLCPEYIDIVSTCICIIHISE